MTVVRRLVASLAVVWLHHGAGGAGHPDRPAREIRSTHARPAAQHLLLLLADDLGYGDVAPPPYGSTSIHTPALARLAREGVTLAGFRVAAPICTPSRMAFLTGCYPYRFGMVRRSEHATYARPR